MKKTKVIDSGVLYDRSRITDILPYIQEPWKTQVADFGFRLNVMYSPPGKEHIVQRSEPGSAPAGNAYDPLKLTYVDPYEIQYVVLINNIQAVSVHVDSDYSAALASASNDYMIDSVLSKNIRYKGSVTIATQDPQQAAKEIERVGEHPQMVQIAVSGGAQLPFGHRYYNPIYEAAQRCRLPIRICSGAEGGGMSKPPSAAGYVSDYFQYYCVLPQNVQAHMVSLIGEAVFERFPQLKFIVQGNGLSWLAPLMWRMDRSYQALRATVPSLKKKPSDYIRDHFYVAVSALDDAGEPELIYHLLDTMNVEHMLLYASGFPDWEGAPPSAFLPNASAAIRDKILFSNAQTLYGL